MELDNHFALNCQHISAPGLLQDHGHRTLFLGAGIPPRVMWLFEFAMCFWNHRHVGCPALPHLLLMGEVTRHSLAFTGKGFCSLLFFPFQDPFVPRVCQRASPPSSIPVPRILSPSQASRRSCCLRGASSPPPPPGWVQGPDFHLNSRLSAEASPPSGPANKEPTVRRRDVQPALTAPLSSMRLFSPCAGARGAGLVGNRLPALGNMPLILSSPSLFPLLPLWSSRGLFELQLVFVRHRGDKISQTGLVAGDGMR